jgi:exodeoxyribonuclease-3
MHRLQFMKQNYGPPTLLKTRFLPSFIILLFALYFLSWNSFPVQDCYWNDEQDGNAISLFKFGNSNALYDDNTQTLCIALRDIPCDMKIITWNCNMAFRKKADIILTHKPDILVIPECEHPDKLLFKGDTPKPADSLWFGHNSNKGLAIFSYCDFRFRVLDVHNDSFKMVIPIAVSGGQFDFTLFAIWANNPKDPDGQYITQVWKAVNYYESLIASQQTILIGDFNSNTIWDRPKREGNHSTVVRILEKKGIFSVYHKYFNQTQGTEQHATLYMYRHKDKPYHIDYCFASPDMLEHLKSVDVGDFEFWNKYSDHVPVIVTFDTGLYKGGAHAQQRLAKMRADE